MKSLRVFATLIAAMALIAMASGTALASVNYATVTGYAEGSSDNNHVESWPGTCTKTEFESGSTYVLEDSHTLVIVKAGSEQSAPGHVNTLFANATAGQTVWADSNGSGAYDSTPAPGDKGISHIIFCDGTSPTPSSSESTEPTATPSSSASDEPTATPTSSATTEPTPTSTVEVTATPTTEPTATPTTEPTATPTEEATPTPTPTCVDINTASFDDLVALLTPLDDFGILPETLAQRVIDARPFTSLDDLVARVSGIGTTNIDQISSQLCSITPPPIVTPTPSLRTAPPTDVSGSTSGGTPTLPLILIALAALGLVSIVVTTPVRRRK